MPKKRNSAGYLQNYDSRTGRFCAEGPIEAPKNPYYEKIRKREAKRTELRNKAEKTSDRCLKDVYNAIEDEFPDFVTAINFVVVDSEGKQRELDIKTKRHIIEVKSGKCRHHLEQLLEQKQYAKEHGKSHLVYAPNILDGTKREYERHGIVITKTIDELLEKLK